MAQRSSSANDRIHCLRNEFESPNSQGKDQFRQKSHRNFFQGRWLTRTMILTITMLLTSLGSVNSQQITTDINSRRLEALQQAQDEGLDDKNNVILKGAADNDFDGGSGEGDVSSKQKIGSSSGLRSKVQNDWEKKDLKKRYQDGDEKLIIQSIVPRGGPMTGGTKVTVRADGIEDLVDIFPDPKCRFGGNAQIVDANYVRCSKRPITFYESEKSQVKNFTCILCEDTLPNPRHEIIAMSVSLSGKFDDVHSSLPYRYYKPSYVSNIYPRYGPKDGDTVVQVWGDNFLDLGDDFRCNFGTRSTKAYYVTDTFLWCRSATSDVVGKAMPFSVSLNRQQNSKQDVEYWYYNDPTLQKLIPDFGPLGGKQLVTLKGNNFYPFDFVNDINNANDTFCMWGPLGKTPAKVVSSTEARCNSPPNTFTPPLTEVQLQFTLNNQNVSEGMEFIFFNPPGITEATPLRGPTYGGTEVHIYGNKFNHARDPVCIFGGITVDAKFVTPSHMICTSPPFHKPGETTMTVKYRKDRFHAGVLIYLYFEPPVVESIEPACGPIKGFTQIYITGQNFGENNGFGKASCKFNGTYSTNATVISNDTMYCDSPMLDLSDSDTGDYYYSLSVTADGESFSLPNVTFNYYDDPKIQQIEPWNGPFDRPVHVAIKGKDLKTTNMCDFKVRFGQYNFPVSNASDTLVEVMAGPVKIAGASVVAISGNGQQYNDDVTLHFRDTSNTYIFHQPWIVEDVQPNMATISGGTPIHLTGMLFDQFKNHNGTTKEMQYMCRFVDDTGKVIGGEKNMTQVSDIEYICVAPKSTYSGPTVIEVMENGQDWQDIGRNITMYAGPHVTHVSPPYGVTKNPKGTILDISGDNFQCPGGDCSKIRVRFTNYKGDQIFVSGKMSSSGTIQCVEPEYPSPETLTVDVSFNGLDWSNDNVNFSYIDPFVLGVKPRLISPRGDTKLLVEGFGFAHTGDDEKQQIAYAHDYKPLQAGGKTATKVYKVLSEMQVLVESFDQNDLSYGGKNIAFEPMTVQIRNPDGEYDPNDIYIYYYKEPAVQKQSAEFAYINEDKMLIFNVDFQWGEANHHEFFRDNANLTCRFSSAKNGSMILYSDAFMETSPMGSMKPKALPDQIRCRTPIWESPEQIKLDVSFNGQNYYGDFPMTMVDPISTLRLSPLSGPVDGGTLLTIYGSGMNASIPQEAEVLVKFGNIMTQPVDKSNITDIEWSDDDYYDELHLSDKLLKQASGNWDDIEDKKHVDRYSGAITPNISHYFDFTPPDVKGAGGVIPILIGENVGINVTDHRENSTTYKMKIEDQIETAFYDTSDLEFYFYRQPFITKLEPKSGLTSGGTMMDISGAWFQEIPMYGVFPFCKLGENVVRGRFVSTTRVQCNSPPTKSSGMAVKIEFSLNGQDWIDTGHDFGYYERPELFDIRPRYGNIAGGTEIWLKGNKFSNATNGLKTVMCRFTQMPEPTAQGDDDENGMQEADDFNPPVRFMPAYYVDKDTMKCASPSGWAGGDRVWVDLTFNGIDFTENKFEFDFYAFYGSFPKSAPYDSTNQFIQVRGKGFTQDMAILCILDGQEMAPLAVHFNLIKCPMHVDKDKDRRMLRLGGSKRAPLENKQSHGVGENDFGSVPFAVKLEGIKQGFGNFHYYRQCVIDDVTPLIAPNDGEGAIYIIGRGFRDDFENAKLGCRIGNTLAKAQLLDSNTVRCTVNNELPLIEEGESLLVTVALNTYSWAASDFSMLPYGIEAMYPNMGPIGQSTNVLIVGKGFDNDLRENGRCKFGTEENYIVVEANVLDNEHLICRSPSDAFNLPDKASEIISVPFAIAFQEDLYFPYTNGGQKYRMYRQPKLEEAYPREVKVGKLSEVFVSASEGQPFWQPTPPPEGEQFEQYGLKCKFGRFGSAPATYMNRTHILCLTPNIRESPSEIATETVPLTVAMNGVDYNDDYSDLTITFVGTGQGLSIWVIIMGTLIFALLIISIIVFLFGLQTLIAAQNQKSDFNENAAAENEGGNGPDSKGRPDKLARGNAGSRNTGR